MSHHTTPHAATRVTTHTTKKALLLLMLSVSLLAALTSHPILAKELRTLSAQKAGFSEARLSRVTELVDAYIEEGKYTGMVTLVARDGKIVHQHAAGKMGIDNDKPVQQDSLFRIYSMTKPITAVATMILLEQGKIHLDDPVGDYVPELADATVLIEGEPQAAERAITIRHLLTHTAGMTYGWSPTHPVDLQYQQARLFESADLEEFLTKLSAIPLRFQPGTQYYYSVAFDVLGVLIERVSQQPLDEFFREQIFTPLGMTDTFFEVPADKRHRLMSDETWDIELKKIQSVPPEQGWNFDSVSLFMSGGGLVSTVSDYFRFCQMILNGGEYNGARILSPKTVEMMSADHLSAVYRASGFDKFPDGDLYQGQSMALGFGVVTEAAAMPDLSSNGELSWGGLAGTKFWIDPKEQIIGIALVQQYRSPWSLRADFKNATYQALEALH